jgi:phospholipid/cholesterol/gamma-HCH transport system substrate-binding protein
MGRKKTTLAELRVGILVLTAIAILIVFILSVTGDIALFKRTMTLRTRLVEAEGLKKGDEVRLAGRRVGKVDEVDFGPIPSSPDEKSVVVIMTVDASLVGDRIRRDSKAVLGQQGFLGDRVIDITPGTRDQDPIRDGEEIASADQPGLAKVFEGASDLLVQFNTVGKQLQELMDNINKGQGTVGKLLHDDTLYVNLNRTVLQFQDIANRANTGTGTIARFLNDPKLYDDLRAITTDLQAIASNLRSGKGTAGKLLTDEQFYNRANDTIAKLNSISARFDQITTDIENGRGTLGKLVKDDKLHNDLQALVASLRNISQRLDQGEGSAGKLLHDERLYNNLNQMSSETVKLLYDFRQNPKKYLSIKVSLF